ncbi:hypothetical protein KCMC57_up33890 [Kitasatospora sp. CMC57]|uniref:Uncharacterized protein n=1 Tax=Kitasatospora sp. CMC57 TaxID=3231513 RepID=A0AB33K538_9ACTN
MVQRAPFVAATANGSPLQRGAALSFRAYQQTESSDMTVRRRASQGPAKSQPPTAMGSRPRLIMIVMIAGCFTVLSILRPEVGAGVAAGAAVLAALHAVLKE